MSAIIDNTDFQVNDYDVGIEDVDMHIEYAYTNGEFVALQDNQMENKFFLSQTDKKYLVEQEEHPKHIYVVCMKDNYNSENCDMLFEKIVDRKEFLKVYDELAILKAPYSMLYNYNLKSMAKYIDGNFLDQIFTNIKFNNQEIVLLMFELTESIAKLNISLYFTYTDINDLLPMVELMYHYNKSYKKPVMKQFVKYLENLSCSQFWTNEENGKLLNMTNVFSKRGFDYKIKKIETFKKSLEKMSSQEQEKVKNMLSGNKKNDTNIQFDYLHKLKKNVKQEDKQEVKQEVKQEDKQEVKQEEQVKVNQEEQVKNKLKSIGGTSEFFDIFTAIKNNEKRTFYMNTKQNISKEYIIKIFDYITEDEELFHMINMIMLSKDICHYLFEKQIFDKVSPFINKHKAFYKYLFGYTWTTLFIDESIMKTKAEKSNEFVFTIDIANKLPYFPLSHDDIFQSPYNVITVDNKVLDPKNNVLSLPHNINSEKCYGVCNLEQFKYRMNLFMTGDSKNFPLKDINWEFFGISGSIMSACLQKESPLFQLVCSQDMSEETKWRTFFNHYYDEADIDLMCYSTSIFDFLDKVDSVISSLDKNLGENTTKTDCVKNMATFVTKSFFTERFTDFNDKYNTQHTPESMCKLLDSKETNELHEYLYEIYITNKFKFNDKIRKETKNKKMSFLKNLLEPNSIKELNVNFANYNLTSQTANVEDNEMCFYINDFRDEENKVPEKENVMLLKFSENVKFKISNKNMLHQIELFKTNHKDFFGLVGRFHLPCVRAYYQADNVYILPSCISAMMTGINIDYKYFAGTRDPVDIINKYRMRGFGTLLSKTELEHFKEYNKIVKTFGGMFNETEDSKILGTKEIGDKIFRPKQYKDGLPSDIYANYIPTSQFNTTQDVKKYYEDKFDKKLPQDLTFIDKEGNVSKYNSWIATAYWNSV